MILSDKKVVTNLISAEIGDDLDLHGDLKSDLRKFWELEEVADGEMTWFLIFLMRILISMVNDVKVFLLNQMYYLVPDNLDWRTTLILRSIMKILLNHMKKKVLLGRLMILVNLERCIICHTEFC